MKYKERRLCSFGKFMFRLRRRDVDQFKGWKKKKAPAAPKKRQFDMKRMDWILQSVTELI